MRIPSKHSRRKIFETISKIFDTLIDSADPSSYASTKRIRFKVEKLIKIHLILIPNLETSLQIIIYRSKLNS